MFTEYPFVLSLGFFDPEYGDDSKYKIQSVSRITRDPTTETNKRRSQMLDIIESQINSGWIARVGKVVNKDELYQSGQGPVIWVDEQTAVPLGQIVEKIPPAQIPQGMFQLTELFDADGEHLGEKGHEFGATTGRRRRCGWLDTVALRRSFQFNSVTGLCITKLDVLDGLEAIRLCVGYKLDGQELDAPPVGAEKLSRCEPIYIEMPGWSESTVGAQSYEQLPQNARDYLKKIEALCGVPIDIISTGPDRDETIVLKHPFNG